MNGADALAILPLILLAGTPSLVLLAITIRRSHAFSLGLTVIGLLASFGSLWIAAGVIPRRVTPLLIIDQYALFYTGLIVAAAIAVAALSYGYLERQEINRDELYVLIGIATLGSAVLVSSSHLISFFLGLEILSVSLYGMISYLYTRRQPLEAGVKYLILAAASSAFLLFGIALVYSELGTMDFGEIARRIALAGPGLNFNLLLAAMALIVTGIGFKLAVVPFHLWTPDVYEGAPAPVTGFIATVSKGAMFGLLLRYFYQTGVRNFEPMLAVFAIIAVASMIVGNLLALLQSNVKRILAYSSIAHLGYILVAFVAGGRLGAQAVTFYLVAYFVTTLGAFGIVTVLSGWERDADEITDYRGLFWNRPVLAGVFSIVLFSLAGIPVTAGFLAKFYVVAAGASSTIWALIVILVVTSAVGLYYYLRIIGTMYARPAPPEPEVPAFRPLLSIPDRIVLAVLVFLLIWFGILPGPILAQIGKAIATVSL